MKRSEILGLPDPSVLTPSEKAIGGGSPLPPSNVVSFSDVSYLEPGSWASHGGTVVASHGGTVVASHGGTVVASHGGTVTATDTASLRRCRDRKGRRIQRRHLELVEFDPTVDTPTTWTPSEAMTAFLEKHFNCCLTDSEKDEILNDFSNTPVLNASKLDEDVVEQLKSKGKDPHFGQEKVLYKLQEALLDVSSPLMCLWEDLTNPRAEVSRKETMLFTQHALVLLGSASNAVNLERRKIAWARINPSLKGLATESYDKREDQLFAPGFLEKASKKIETQKALAKVSSE